MLTGNAFIGNQEQVKYVGTRFMEWSLRGPRQLLVRPSRL
jgi:nitrous oxidase accessory protein